MFRKTRVENHWLGALKTVAVGEGSMHSQKGEFKLAIPDRINPTTIFIPFDLQ